MADTTRTKPLAPKQILVGALAGAVILTALGFGLFGFGFGWMTEGSARAMVEDATKETLVGFCVDQARADPAADEKLAALEQGSPWSRGGKVEENGWATILGQKSSTQGVANECADRLLSQRK